MGTIFITTIMPAAISTPIIFPKIIPNNWDEWNKVWNRNKKFVPKVQGTNNLGSVPWIGFDIYVKDGYDATDIIKYKCENVNCPDLFASLFDNLDKFPLDIQVVRVLQSMSSVPAHQDFAHESNGHSFRSVIHDNNPKQTWYYQNNEGTRQYLTMPDDTNTWWYDDNRIKHGTEYIFGHEKQLIMYRGVARENQVKTLLDDSMSHYSNYVLFE